MPVRKNWLPKSILDLLPFCFLIVIVPVTYWFEIWVVLPGLFPLATYPIKYCSLFAFGHFLLINVLGNLLGVVITDTSIRGRMMPSITSPEATGFCDICKTVVPPRSYHCPSCRICILRRDHHCMFTACCIGNFNYRYFLMFLLHLFVSTAFCLPFNIAFLWDYVTFGNSFAIIKVLFPMVMLFWGMGFNQEQGYLLICVVSLAGMFFVGLWFYFHLRLALRGRLVHEIRKNISIYDKGMKANLRDILGEKWFLVWLSPFIRSPPLSDGVHFETKLHAT